ncbi:MAG: hypothetical protein KBS53_05845 [Bacteroidales bacterium]|nr:hypothetical protein [Candidatus Hennigimonas equi]
MTYRVRVSLPGIKGFARVYDLDSKNSLYAFHKQMLSDMEFPQDQIVLFKAFDAAENVVARYATFDLGDGSIEHISIAQVVSAGITHFVYFYDTTNKKSVILTIEGESDRTVGKPTLDASLSKGPIPEDFLNGYVAFEDLPPEKRKAPDDDDFDDVDDDDAGDDMEDDDEEEYGSEEGDE